MKVPPLGESIVEATVSRWVKQPGDSVNAGDTLVELDTDKITVEVPAVRAGVLTKQSVKEGDIVHVDDVLGEIDETAAGAVAPAAAAAAPVTASAPSAAAQGAFIPAPSPSASGAGVKSAPAARRAADERGIDIASVPGTGRGGVVSKPDVLAAASALAAAPPLMPASPASPAAPAQPKPAAAAPASAPAPVLHQPPRAAGERETREKLNTRRKRIAQNLLQSHLATAHLTTFNEIDMSAVTALRERS
ncbi:MAG TPA: biotin/lipoyl-containing protein, partial [Candidatus Elarobacter sp.]|nr:biotin/lipoyl-containing protein [Candidatus Elarobacter sp.]